MSPVTTQLRSPRSLSLPLPAPSPCLSLVIRTPLTVCSACHRFSEPHTVSWMAPPWTLAGLDNFLIQNKFNSMCMSFSSTNSATDAKGAPCDKSSQAQVFCWLWSDLSMTQGWLQLVASNQCIDDRNAVSGVPGTQLGTYDCVITDVGILNLQFRCPQGRALRGRLYRFFILSE